MDNPVLEVAIKGLCCISFRH